MLTSDERKIAKKQRKAEKLARKLDALNEQLSQMQAPRVMTQKEIAANKLRIDKQRWDDAWEDRDFAAAAA